MKYYGSMTREISARELRNGALARRAAAESFVLLQNDGTLPLQTKKAALYGMGARKTVSGGEGSGSMSSRYTVSIEQGLENAGITVTTKAWLDDYDAEYERTYEEYRRMVEEKIAGITNPVQQIPEAHKYKYRYPSGRLIDEADVRASDTDTALYVLMRQGGEGADRKNEPGDFWLTDIEKANLRFLAQHYAHTVLIVNVGGLVDLSVLEEAAIGAVVFFVQGGMEGGNALADVLTGRTNFCGRLADTWPRSYSDIPGGENFGSLNGDLENEYYTEGVYVGYRYFDSFDVAVRWPFGYGLSYTKFSQEIGAATLNGTCAEVSVTVTNTGRTAGREVVQGYLRKPDRTSPIAQELAAFAKTGLLKPGESETVTLSVDFAKNGLYDTECAAWVLPAGEYILSVGRHSRDTAPATVFALAETVTLRQCRTCCAPEQEIGEISPESLPEINTEGIPVLTLDPAVFSTETVDYTVPGAAGSALAQTVLNRLTEEEKIELVRGGDLQAQGPGQFQILGASGKTAVTLAERGVPNVVFSDGPAGIYLMEEAIYAPDGSQKPVHIPEVYNWGLMRKMGERMLGHEGVHVYRYATAWPVGELLAQSWDTALLREIGAAVAEEMVEFGITLWLAPAMNIHRNPLCGRTFEYYSEDPYLTGKMAAALTKGVQSRPGVGVTVKHFCCNNQEDNRLAVSENVSEKALRQIYLRGFEIALQEAAPKAVMSSYNKLNGTYTGERADLCTDILRCEWGYTGLVMSDWNTGYHSAKALHAGVDLMMPGSETDKKALYEAGKSGTLDTGALNRSAVRVLNIIDQSLTAELDQII